jgi:hypothetical protein
VHQACFTERAPWRLREISRSVAEQGGFGFKNLRRVKVLPSIVNRYTLEPSETIERLERLEQLERLR